ncbi:MAG: metal ABC transporter ATP-binding protein [Rhabdochlamydiaceae bacterium]|nr:metal ABC transporter ATP-binding protein [Rhabdochlamydiaceae bacterium]
MNVLDVEQLSVSYDETAVLWDISFSLPKASFIGIIGPNGAGKSTLLKALLGLTPPLSGTVRFFGSPLESVRQKVAYVPQRSSVDWDFPMTAYDLVMMGRFGQMGLMKWASKSDKEKVLNALRAVEMEELSHRQIGQLSGGQQQRLFIARALVQDADLFLLDEPFAGIDLATEKTLLNLFSKLKAQGKTIIMVHHDLITAQKVFDWLVLLNTCLIAAGPTNEVLTSQNLAKTYGQGSRLLDEAVFLAQNQTSGIL